MRNHAHRSRFLLCALIGHARLSAIVPVVSLALVLVAWQIGYSRSTFIPAPSDVWSQTFETMRDSSTYGEIGRSLSRLLLGLLAGFSLGVITSIQAGRSARFEQIMKIYVRIMLTLPSLLVALLWLVVFGTAEAGVVVVVAVIVYPFVAVPVLEGVKSLDRGQMEMARVYRVGTVQVMRSVAIPHLAPYLFSSLRNAHSIAWKVLIVAEVFSVRSGIGYRFQRAFGLFDLSEVMVWLILFLAVIGLAEYGVFTVAERWVFRWRPIAPRRRWSKGVRRLALP